MLVRLYGRDIEHCTKDVLFHAYIFFFLVSTKCERLARLYCFALRTSCTASRTFPCTAAGAATTPLLFANVLPTLKSSLLPWISVTWPPASLTIKSPAAWSQIFSW